MKNSISLSFWLFSTISQPPPCCSLLPLYKQSSFPLCFQLVEVDVDIATHIRINDYGPNQSLLSVETADLPGLLVDLVKIITDISIAVQSGEFDTEVGLLAKAKFHVSYKDKPISKPLQLVLANSLRYFLRRPFTEEASFEPCRGPNLGLYIQGMLLFTLLKGYVCITKKKKEKKEEEDRMVN
ncbi:hypothetical protein ACB092_05G270500 [Castanea dentata]